MSEGLSLDPNALAQRDRKLPVTGQISPRLMRELAALTGRPLE